MAYLVCELFLLKIPIGFLVLVFYELNGPGQEYYSRFLDGLS